MTSSANDISSHLGDPITAHMRTDFARLTLTQTVGQALADVRTCPPEGRIIYFYVVDDDNVLRGVVPTRRLLLNPESTPVREIMVANVITIPALASVLDACEFFLQYRLLAFPVVDTSNRLLGIVDVDLYTAEAADLERREGNDDLFQLIGVHVTAGLKGSPLLAFRSRFPWLLANISGGILAAFLSGVFEAELRQVVALALFIPVVLALAESVSIQSVSLALQALRGSRPTLRTMFHKLRLELTTGMLLGVASGLVVALVAAAWLGQPLVALCLLGGIAGGVTCAAMIGVAMPNLLRWLKREPQVAAGPIALATTDMATLITYFTLARWMLM